MALHDHHCGVFGVCVCGKNYKFFILFIFYAGVILFALGSSVIVLTNSMQNEMLRDEHREQSLLLVMMTMATGASLAVFIPILFTCIQKPYGDSE